MSDIKVNKRNDVMLDKVILFKCLFPKARLTAFSYLVLYLIVVGVTDAGPDAGLHQQKNVKCKHV